MIKTINGSEFKDAETVHGIIGEDGEISWTREKPEHSTAGIKCSTTQVDPETNTVYILPAE